MGLFGRIKNFLYPKQDKSIRLSLALSLTPFGYPTFQPSKRPKTRGLPKADAERLIMQWRLEYRRHFKEVAEFNRIRAMSIGIEKYQWVGFLYRKCSVARKNNGKIFRYDNPPESGHPCEGRCDEVDWCRCITKSIIEMLETPKL